MNNLEFKLGEFLSKDTEEIVDELLEGIREGNTKANAIRNFIKNAGKPVSASEIQEFLEGTEFGKYDSMALWTFLKGEESSGRIKKITLQNKKSGERVYWEWVGGEPILSKEDFKNLVDRYSGEYKVRKVSSDSIEISSVPISEITKNLGSDKEWGEPFLPPEFHSKVLIGGNGEMTFYSGYYPGEKVEKEVYSYENYDDLVKKLDELLEKRMFSRSKMIDIFRDIRMRYLKITILMIILSLGKNMLIRCMHILRNCGKKYRTNSIKY